MEKKFSKLWISSKNPRKQRKYRYNAPLHLKQKFVSVHLSKELRGKYNKRSLQIRKGDTVKILRGQYKNKTGTVEKVSVKLTKIYIQGIESVKKEGTKNYVPFEPSNLMIITLSLEDKKRKKKIIKEKKVEKVEKSSKKEIKSTKKSE
jgi:large subunit ribosomal protein L24